MPGGAQRATGDDGAVRCGGVACRGALCNPVSAPRASRTGARRASMSPVGGRPSLADRPFRPPARPPAEISENARSELAELHCASPSHTAASDCASLSRKQLSFKTKERDGRSPLPLAGRPVSPVATRTRHSRQFSLEPRLLRSYAASSLCEV